MIGVFGLKYLPSSKIGLTVYTGTRVKDQRSVQAFFIRFTKDFADQSAFFAEEICVKPTPYSARWGIAMRHIFENWPKGISHVVLLNEPTKPEYSSILRDLAYCLPHWCPDVPTLELVTSNSINTGLLCELRAVLGSDVLITKQPRFPYQLSREILGCPAVTIHDEYSCKHNPVCPICGGTAQVPGPVCCSRLEQCFEEGFTNCETCQVSNNQRIL